MSEKPDDASEAVAAEIMRYLRRHLEAADTLEGVARWWLSRQRYEEALATVERAMSMLVERGLVEEHRLPDGTVVYRCSPRLEHPGATDASESSKSRRNH